MWFKEGQATTAEYFLAADTAGKAAGAVDSDAYNTAFENSLIARFNTNYNSTSTTFWNVSPQNPTSVSMNGNSNAYVRPGTAYLALRQILGHDNYKAALVHMQQAYRGGSIVEEQLKTEFHKYMPNQSLGCYNKLEAFFKQWWDTSYTGSPAAGNKPSITGPGLAGGGFYDANGGCSDYATPVDTTPGATVPATLSLTLGTPATFGNFTPGVGEGLHVLLDGQRDLLGGRRGAVGRRSLGDRSGPSGQRRVLAPGGAEGRGRLARPARRPAPARSAARR